MEVQKTFSALPTEQEPSKISHSRVKSDTKTSRFKDLKVVSVLNKSKFTVYRAESPSLKTQYALKVFPYKTDKVHISYLKEARFTELQHPNIVNVLEHNPEKMSYAKGKSLMVSYILMELAPYGDFSEVIMNNKLPTDEKLARTYFRQLISGLEYLHANNIAHMDLKPENLLIGEGYNLKLTDFDSSVFLNEKQIGKVGTLNYRSPELKEGKCVDAVAADIFSCGVILFVLKAKMFPYAEDTLINGHDLHEYMINGDDLFWANHPSVKKNSESFSRDFRDLFMRMVCFDPTERISIEDIKKHSWYNGPTYDEEQLASIMSEVAVMKTKTNC